MTDHNAKGGKKAEPCAWCGVPAQEMGIAVVHHQCEIGRLQRMSVECWNLIQPLILAQRRKDFEAGFNVGYDLARGVGEYGRRNGFDDYLSRCRK